MYKCHKLVGTGYYLKSRSDIVRLISCLPKSNKGMKDDYLLSLESGMTVFIAQLGWEIQVGTLGLGPLGEGISPFSFIPFCF